MFLSRARATHEETNLSLRVTRIRSGVSVEASRQAVASRPGTRRMRAPSALKRSSMRS
jgi:hypothetical protein